MINTTFEDRVEAAREANVISITTNRLLSNVAIDDTLKRESLSTMKVIVNGVCDLLDLDSERLEGQIKSARKSEYGRVPQLLIILANMYAWPILDKADAKDIDDKQEEILDYLADTHKIKVSGDLLLDIKEAKGYHSFLDKDTYEVIDGVEPEFEEITYYLQTLAEHCGLPFIDIKLDEVKWNKVEAKSLIKIQIEHEAAQTALSNHEELINS